MLLKKSVKKLNLFKNYYLETESIYQIILNEIAQQYGKEYTPDVQAKILGTPEQDTAKIFLRELDIPLSIDEFLEKYHKRMEEELKHPQYMPGIILNWGNAILT